MKKRSESTVLSSKVIHSFRCDELDMDLDVRLLNETASHIHVIVVEPIVQPKEQGVDIVAEASLRDGFFSAVMYIDTAQNGLAAKRRLNTYIELKGAINSYRALCTSPIPSCSAINI